MQRPNELIAIVKASKILLKKLVYCHGFNTFKYIYIIISLIKIEHPHLRNTAIVLLLKAIIV
jgi:hypothetical protein